MFMLISGVIFTLATSLGPALGGTPLMNIGYGVIACAMFVVIYGSVMYFRRLYLMVNAKPYGYADTAGPVVLALFFIILLCVYILAYFWSYPYPNATLTEQAGFCVQRNLGLSATGGFTVLEFQPSGLYVDEVRNLLLIASLDDVKALPSGMPMDEASNNVSMTFMYEFPEGSEDLEAIMMRNDVVYVASEGKKSADGQRRQADIIALGYTSAGTLNETTRWRIDSPHVVSACFLKISLIFHTHPSHTSNRFPRLLIGGNRIHQRSSMVHSPIYVGSRRR